MLQTRLPVVNVPPENREELNRELKEIYHNVKDKFKVFGTFQEVLVKSRNYFS